MILILSLNPDMGTYCTCEHSDYVTYSFSNSIHTSNASFLLLFYDWFYPQPSSHRCTLQFTSIFVDLAAHLDLSSYSHILRFTLDSLFAFAGQASPVPWTRIWTSQHHPTLRCLDRNGHCCSLSAYQDARVIYTMCAWLCMYSTYMAMRCNQPSLVSGDLSFPLMWSTCLDMYVLFVFFPFDWL